MTIPDLRAQKPSPYPDHALYIEHVCRQREIDYVDLDDGYGTALLLRWRERHLALGMGKPCVYPLNSAPAMAISRDKDFTNKFLSAFSIPNLGGRFFFLHDRHGRLRRPGNDLNDAYRYLEAMSHVAFVKPLSGSRGDYAEIVRSPAEFAGYVGRVSRYYDSIIIQQVFSGDEYRVFVIDDEVIFTILKAFPKLVGNGTSDIAELAARHNTSLTERGVSLLPGDLAFVDAAGRNYAAGDVLPAGLTIELRGRANFSAGGAGRLVEADLVPPGVHACAKAAARAIGLRLAGVDIFVRREREDADADIRVIEVNGNPSIRSLETLSRCDLIERIWHMVFDRVGFGHRV